jgi:hypothetical protein
LYNRNTRWRPQIAVSPPRPSAAALALSDAYQEFAAGAMRPIGLQQSAIGVSASPEPPHAHTRTFCWAAVTEQPCMRASDALQRCFTRPTVTCFDVALAESGGSGRSSATRAGRLPWLQIRPAMQLAKIGSWLASLPKTRVLSVTRIPLTPVPVSGSDPPVAAGLSDSQHGCAPLCSRARPVPAGAPPAPVVRAPFGAPERPIRLDGCGAVRHTAHGSR